MEESTSDPRQEHTPSAEANRPLETLLAISECLLQLEDGSAAPGLMDAAQAGLARLAVEAQGADGTGVAGLCDLGDRVLQAIRTQCLSASSPVIDAMLEMCETMAGAIDGGSDPCGADIVLVTEKLQELLTRDAVTGFHALPVPLVSTPWPGPGTGLAPDMVAEFKAESVEGLQMLEATLLEFERNPRDTECLRAIFRVIHNIKGAADYVGLIQIKTLSHRVEDVLDLTRAGRCEMTTAITDLIFHSVDELRAMITGLQTDGEQDRDLAGLVSALELTKQTPLPEPPAETCDSCQSDDVGIYVSSAEQQLESIAAGCCKLLQGDASDVVLSMIHRGVTTLLAAAPYLEYLESTRLAQPAHELLQAIEVLRQHRTAASEQIAASEAQRSPEQLATQQSHGIVACCEEIVEGNASDTVLATLVRELSNLRTPDAAGGPAELAEAAIAFVQTIDAFRKSRAQHLTQLQIVSGVDAVRSGLGPEPCAADGGEVPVQVTTSSSSAGQEVAAIKKPTAGRGEVSGGASPASPAGKTMRVDQVKLDDYINLAGELVIARNALLHDFGQIRIDGANYHRLKESVERVQRIVADIQANAMSMRMVPVMSVFQRFPRMVRDLAKAQGKQIEIQMFGEDTELDKQVAEKLGDPLVHLIRNSADHGIELPDQRRSAGKSECGLISLRAGREGSSSSPGSRWDFCRHRTKMAWQERPKSDAAWEPIKAFSTWLAGEQRAVPIERVRLSDAES